MVPIFDGQDASKESDVRSAERETTAGTWHRFLRTGVKNSAALPMPPSPALCLNARTVGVERRRGLLGRIENMTPSFCADRNEQSERFPETG